MKYLKKFEYNEEEYEIGDYVLVDLPLIKDYYFSYATNGIDDDHAIIIQVNDYKDDEHEDHYIVTYKLLFYNDKVLDEVRPIFIIRKLNNTESKDFVLKTNTNKFNI